MQALVMIAGFVALVLGASWLVKGASRLARALGIAPIIVGLTVVAFGTSAPELAVGVASGLAGTSGVALGNVVGSNIANVLLILGLSAVVAPLTVSRRLVRMDVPVMIGVSLVVVGMSLDGNVGWLDGLILVAGVLAYMGVLFVQARRPGQSPAGIEASAEVATEVTGEVASGWRARLIDLVFIVVGLGLLTAGSDWLVDSATAISRALGVSDLVIGLTLVAVGTSLPELATSLVAAFRGERDLAVGNVVGSNIFNLLTVLGVSSLVSGTGIPVTPAALHFDIPVMVVTALVCLPVFFTGYEIARWEGVLFLGYYVAYVVLLFLDGTHAAAAHWLRISLGAFALPLTFVTLLVLTWRARQRSRQSGKDCR